MIFREGETEFSMTWKIQFSVSFKMTRLQQKPLVMDHYWYVIFLKCDTYL